MAIAVTHKDTNSSGTDASSYTSGAFTPTANALLVACFAAQSGNPPVINTVTGGGLTWSLIATKNYRSGSTDSTIFIYAAQASSSPSSMDVTFAFTATMTGGSWSVFEVTGTDVANGVVQTFVQAVATAGIDQSGTSTAVTLAAAGSADNRPFYVSAHDANEGTTERSNWTEIGDTNHGTPNNGFETQWRSAVYEVDCSASWTTSSIKGGIGFEIKAGATSAIKTVNGLAKASVKTFNGLAIASVKSINGLE
jgi:hypothetical protein